MILTRLGNVPALERLQIVTDDRVDRASASAFDTKPSKNLVAMGSPFEIMARMKPDASCWVYEIQEPLSID
ncbi:hypothetical protein XI03_09625 [Bradyrhizobium sp. CCBAU 65884]|nr:hypothetical protein [Bradyrhizobium sp. CCBAU 65884]